MSDFDCISYIKELKNKIKNTTFEICGINFDFEDILIVSIIIFLIYQENNDYILYLILILLILT